MRTPQGSEHTTCAKVVEARAVRLTGANVQFCSTAPPAACLLIYSDIWRKGLLIEREKPRLGRAPCRGFFSFLTRGPGTFDRGRGLLIG